MEIKRSSVLRQQGSGVNGARVSEGRWLLNEGEQEENGINILFGNVLQLERGFMRKRTGTGSGEFG